MSEHIIPEWSPKEVNTKLKQGEKFVILDVREDEEWEEDGHIAEAKHIPLGQLPERHGELDRNQNIVVVCRSGGRSARACEYLASLQYKVINMPGGMSHWDGEVVFGK
ncbi:rhodanese-like domain-containing protein [Paenibacillus sediminis]|uniref:Rhodanese-related sulfurtransferase n=1 Tax=Paenibacillus sediminis TaxID=664909 RepID=A0ABS4H0E7_9BACL|nr:rhodanese-like domain-containing protein [Paenibacillus sediminis]MBP1935998.1 rhodanese-related sulfurtransferase [Paenibacillus sediminis]